MRLEITETIDVSREGLMIRRSAPNPAASRVWVAFPFDPGAAGAVQPETPARILRSEPDPAGGCSLALRLEAPQRAGLSTGGSERRKSPRIPFALPIFVRAQGAPWPEESMTRDISRSGARFETAQVFATGEIVLAKIPWGEWDRAGEMMGRVRHVEPLNGEAHEGSNGGADNGSRVLNSVGVEWVRAAKL